MEKIKTFIAENGSWLMLAGILTLLASVVLSVIFNNTPRYADTLFPTLSFSLGVAGFAVYVAGRVSVAIQRKRARAFRSSAAVKNDDGD